MNIRVSMYHQKRIQITMEIYLQILIIFGIVGSFNSSGVYGLDCYKCTSNERADCAVKPSEKISVVPCKRERDTCATGIFNKITHRGCLSDMPNGVCSSYGSNPCVQCKSPLCNGQFYPADRRSCYQCLGSECINVTKSKIKSTPCRNYVKNDSCYTDIVGIQMTVRGCASDGTNACKNTKCLSCNYDGCNDLVGVSEINCYSCSYIKSIGNSNKDLSCKRPQNASDKCLVSNITTCVEKVLLGDKGKCYTSYNEQTDVTKRGCLSTSGAVGIGNDKLTECYGDLCNRECVDIKCIICDSSKNPKCHNQATYLKVENCPKGTNRCFACENKKGHVVRGCNNENNENQHCNYCYDEDGCNRGNVRTCYKCTSSSNPNCAYWLNTSSIDLEVCDNPMDNCVVTAIPNSYTVRGCQSKVPECTPGDPVCKRCNGSLCNDGIVPENRKFCHQCSDSKECVKKQDTSKALPCLNYSLNDYCFAYTNDNNSFTRGCSSDAGYNDCRKLPNGKCRICYDNGCNSWPLIRMPTLACIKCNETDDICAWGHEKESAKLCSSQVPYFSDETCFTYEHSKTNVDRGCTLDFRNHLVENERVHLCKNPGCNNQHKIIQSCIQCNSKGGHEACKGTAVNVSSTDCRKDSLQLFKNRGCYIMKTAEGDVIRGCVFDLTNDELQACKTKKNQCIYCAGQGCNKQNPPSLANKIQQCSYLFIMLTFVLLYNTSRK